MQLEKLIKVCTIGLILVAMMAGCTVNQTAPPITMTQPESEIVEPSEDMQNQDGTIEVEPGNHDSKEEATVALASPTDVTQEPELSVDEPETVRARIDIRIKSRENWFSFGDGYSNLRNTGPSYLLQD